jgi:hypothetical protein
MTDFRALCEEMADWIDDETRIGQSETYLVDLDEHPLVVRARAALDEHPVAPTDEELWEAWGCFEHEPFSKGDTIMQLREFLARWGQS